MADAAQLPDGVADLLDHTLGADGNPGVLADWLDDHSDYWSGFAAALRQSTAPGGREGPVPGFRYRVVCSGVMFWACEGELHTQRGRPGAEVVLLGAYRAVPFVPGVWRRVVLADTLPKAVRRRLWEAFGVSRLADRE